MREFGRWASSRDARGTHDAQPSAGRFETRMGSIALVLNLILGIGCLCLGLMISRDTLRGDRIVAWVQTLFQERVNEDFHVAPVVVYSLLYAAGVAFLAVGFAIFAKWHDFWI